MENDINKQITVLDPSALTTQQLWREIASLKELTFSRIGAVEDSIKVAHEDLVRVPTDVQKQVAGLKELLLNKIDDRIKLVDEKFGLAESVRIEQKNNLITSITKSEQSFSKLTDQQSNLITSIQSGFNAQLDEIKKRLTTIEGIAVGALGQKTEKKDSDRVTIAIIAIITSIVFGLIGYILNK